MNRVELYKMDFRTVVTPQGRELNPHGRFAWLHRLLWRALQRMNALAQPLVEEVEVLRLPLTNDQIFERIFEAYQGLFAVRRKPAEVLIGPGTLDELIGCPQVRDWHSAFSFDARAGFNKTLFNLPIRVVPQMEGVIVLDERH